jgi:hypothetical protein
VVHPKAFRVAGRSSQALDLRQFVFSFSRLFQCSLELQQFIRAKRVAGEVPMGQVPRNIAHRLRILTELCRVVSVHRGQIFAGLESFNGAFAVTPGLNPAKGGWRVTGVPKSFSMYATCSHVSDVYHALSCPRVRLEAAMTAALYQLSQDVYSCT